MGTVTLLLAGSPPAAACSIPVFRFALERWQSSPYDVLIFHRGPLNEADRKAVAKIKVQSLAANVEVTEVDLDGRVDPEYKAIWSKHGGNNPLPWVIARFPDSELESPLAWTGRLDPKAFAALVDSPLRQTIVSTLMRGESAIFILMESGDAKADAAAARMLNTELPRMQKSIVLPSPTPDGPQLRSEMPVRTSFSTLRLSRDDRDEQALVSLLLHCEGGLKKEKGPIVFAVFGRGRVLTALHGKDLKASELETTCRFLCGACSCQVKELNPGVDLLIRARWEAFLEIEVGPPPRHKP
jgi:hypothetical protein